MFFVKQGKKSSDRVKIKQVNKLTITIEFFQIIKVSKCEKMLFKDNLNEILSMVLKSRVTDASWSPYNRSFHISQWKLSIFKFIKFILLVLIQQNVFCKKVGQDQWNQRWLDRAKYDRSHLMVLGTKETAGLLVWQNTKG